MRHNPAAGGVAIMLRTLKMHGMAQAVGELTEQGSPKRIYALPAEAQEYPLFPRRHRTPRARYFIGRQRQHFL
jgi:hypothetical protein